MWRDDLRGIFYITLKDLRAYYLKPPNLSWGIMFPLAFTLAFYIRQLGDFQALVPGLLGLTILFGSTSMAATVIIFERRIGALERLFLAPISLPALVLGKIFGSMVFGLVTTLAVLTLVVATVGLWPGNWVLLSLALALSTLCFSALGAFVSAAVREIFEAQTLSNLFRFPMIFLCGVFVPLSNLPPVLQVVARLFPLTYTVEAVRGAYMGSEIRVIAFDLLILAAYSAPLLFLTTRALARQMAQG